MVLKEPVAFETKNSPYIAISSTHTNTDVTRVSYTFTEESKH